MTEYDDNYLILGETTETSSTTFKSSNQIVPTNLKPCDPSEINKSQQDEPITTFC